MRDKGVLNLTGNAYTATLLRRACETNRTSREVIEATRHLYQYLVYQMVRSYFPREEGVYKTNMGAPCRGPFLARSTEVVIVTLARAGIIPAQVCQDMLSVLLPARNVRQDFYMMTRVRTEEGFEARCGGWKSGGPVAGSIVVIPDPMGATGTSMRAVLRRIAEVEEESGKAHEVVVLCMVTAPEFYHALAKERDGVVVFTTRMDEGLDEKGYIIPGMGDAGDLIYNSKP